MSRYVKIILKPTRTLLTEAATWIFFSSQLSIIIIVAAQVLATGGGEGFILWCHFILNCFLPMIGKADADEREGFDLAFGGGGGGGAATVRAVR